MRKTINYSAKHARDKARMTASAFLFALHCDGVRTPEVQKRCAGIALVPMVSLRSLEELSEQVEKVDWKVSVGKTKDRTPMAFVQCTDCWIDFYRTMTKNGTEDPEETYKNIDPKGKFWDRLTVVKNTVDAVSVVAETIGEVAETMLDAKE